MNKLHIIGQSPVPGGFAGWQTDSDHRLVINVICTSLEGTAAALKSARSMARDLGGVIRLEALTVVPWQLPLDQPQISKKFTEEILCRMAERSDLCSFDPSIHLYLCRDRLDTLAQVLLPESLVVIGGRKHWWPTEESRLAKMLLAWGHRVVFVNVHG